MFKESYLAWDGEKDKRIALCSCVTISTLLFALIDCNQFKETKYSNKQNCNRIQENLLWENKIRQILSNGGFYLLSFSEESWKIATGCGKFTVDKIAYRLFLPF